MPSELTLAHLDAQRRLREIVAAAVASTWTGLGSYDERDVARWLELVLPVVLAGQRQAAALTDAYLASALDRRPLGISPQLVTGPAVRAGAAPADVYRRPFVTVWTALADQTPWEQAVRDGLERATSTAEMDVQLAMRAASHQVQQADERLFGFRRAVNAGACKFCQLVDGAYVKSADAMPLHNRCGCGLEPLTAPHPRAAVLPDGVAVREHGELGPLLTDPAHDFTEL